ncbi:hypothetical protein PV783_24765 [Chitinophaga sp. CC14]|uniref:hypothetical protein n=1 Tax=Chitinophaga sp. CC14 TaxID=3029199 RepID=UPI003B7C9045
MNSFSKYKPGNIVMTTNGEIIVYRSEDFVGIEEIQFPHYHEIDILPVPLTKERMNEMGYEYKEGNWIHEGGESIISGKYVIVTSDPERATFFSVHEIQNYHHSVTYKYLALRR